MREVGGLWAVITEPPLGISNGYSVITGKLFYFSVSHSLSQFLLETRKGIDNNARLSITSGPLCHSYKPTHTHKCSFTDTHTCSPTDGHRHTDTQTHTQPSTNMFQTESKMDTQNAAGWLIWLRHHAVVHVQAPFCMGVWKGSVG